MRSYAAKRDKSEDPIIDALRAVGAVVHQLSQRGVPDLLVCFYNPLTHTHETYLLECKSKGGKLTPAQVAFMETWEGHNLFVVKTVDEALKAIGAI